MKIFVEQNPAVLPRFLFYVGIEDDLAPANEGGRVGGITGGVPKVSPVSDPDRSAVEKAFVQHQLTITAWTSRRC